MHQLHGLHSREPPSQSIGGIAANHMNSTTPEIVVLGSGRMGSQVGIEFAANGLKVMFLARNRVRAERRIQAVIDWAVGLELFDDLTADRALTNVSCVEDVRSLPSSISFALECLPEELGLKVDVLRSVVAQLGGIAIGTNTASLRIDEIGSGIGQPRSVVGMHYWNPPLLMPLVEVTAGTGTAPATVARATELVEAIGKTVVPVHQDVPGFVWNRLQFAMLREALWLVENQVASIDDIDVVVRQGFARRWRDVGLFESIHLGGPENWERVAENLFPVLGDARDAKGLADLVRAASGPWVDLPGRRDRGLVGSPDEQARGRPEMAAGRSLSRNQPE